MTEVILFGVAILIVIALLLSKTNAGLVFLTLCAGNTLLQFADKNLSYINTKLQSNNITSRFIVSDSLLRIIIVLLPVVIILVFSKHYHGFSRWMIQLLPALATGILGCLIIIPLLSGSAQNSIASNPVWNLIQKYQIPIVAVGLLISIVDVVHNSHSGRPKHYHKSKE
ncbi:MAG TPA: hypothetical protein VMQ58_01265 [Candidatus Saccharimonadales bacterium]|nr:hypothetical protein [Candidatus Saccharimonadales bacterium]